MAQYQIGLGPSPTQQKVQVAPPGQSRIKTWYKGLEGWQKAAGVFLIMMAIFLFAGLGGPAYAPKMSSSDRMDQIVGGALMAPILCGIGKIIPWKLVRYYFYFGALGLLGRSAAILMGAN